MVRALVSYTNGSSSILSKGKNQNIGRSPVNPAVNGYLVLLGPGKVKAVERGAGHITLLCAEAAESRHALIVLGPMSLNGSGRTFTFTSHSIKHFKISQTFLLASTISSPTRFPLSSSYARVTPSIQADLEIMRNLCQYYRELFDISQDEIEHEKKCIEALVSLRYNQCQPRKLDGTMVSVYFESRADELNGYAINILDKETTANDVIDKLLKQIHKHDCFFWALFEVIIDQNLERPMYSLENISNVLNRNRTYLPQELNRQATFVVKLNYVQFEKERLQQQNSSSVECEYFDLITKRWISCLWILERSNVR